MPRKKEEKPVEEPKVEKKEEPKKVEKPKVEEKPKIEKKEEPKKVEKKEKKKKLGFLGGKKLKITSIGKKTINGKEYNDVHLIDGTTHLLSDRDLEIQKIEEL